MGVGKSTIGKAVSKHLSMDFVDIDKIIEKKQELTIQKIFEQNGETFFRKLEEKITLEELKKNPLEKKLTKELLKKILKEQQILQITEKEMNL